MANDLETAAAGTPAALTGRGRRVAWLLAFLMLAGVSGAVHVFVRAGNGLTQVRENLGVRWSGVWVIPRDDLYDLVLNTDTHVVWKTDGHQVCARTCGDGPAARRTVWFQAGFHTIDVDYPQDTGDPRLDVSYAPAGGIARSLPSADLLPAMPRHPRLFLALRAADRTFTFLWAAGLLVASIIGVRWIAGRVSKTLGVRVYQRLKTPGVLDTRGHPVSFRIIPLLLLVLVTTYGTALRLEAIAIRYGPVESPSWLRTLQERAMAAVPTIRPSAMTWAPVELSPHRDGTWTRYTSDPYTYLLYAREMRSFYGAHFREPVFSFATKVFLWWLNNQDVAVSFASAAFSVLAILATYMVGTAAFGSRTIGLGAALGVAIERDMISWGVSGWRDDAFAALVMLSLYALLVHRRKPSIASAVALGVVAAVACLTRIFALSFLAPGFVYLLLRSVGPWRDRLRGVVIATAIMAVLVLPYLVNCWRVYGDPLYTLNYQPISYLAWEHATPTTQPGAFGYIGEKVLKAPFRTLDTAALGMTSYPFLNKWDGFEPWLPGLSTVLMALALIGLVLCVASRNGRLLLLVLVSAQVPFAFTWKLSSDWRYTEFAYPFYLLAAAAAVGHVVRLLWQPIGLGSRPPRHWRARFALWGSVAVVLGAAVWGVERTLPLLTFREALDDDRFAVVQAGDRDRAFFVEGWSRPMVNGNVTSRVSQGAVQVVRFPLSRAADYAMVLRLDPFPRPTAAPGSPAHLRVFINWTLVARLELYWNPERVGEYPIRVPAALVTRGDNRMLLMLDGGAPPPMDSAPTQAGLSDWAAFSFWNVSIRPM